jgi:hypothetical protein
MAKKLVKRYLIRVYERLMFPYATHGGRDGRTFYDTSFDQEYGWETREAAEKLIEEKGRPDTRYVILEVFYVEEISEKQT